jgi:hypothetical protein
MNFLITGGAGSVGGDFLLQPHGSDLKRLSP